MTNRGDYQETPWYPQQEHSYQRPQGRSWTPRQYDPGAHLQRLGHFQRPPQPPGPSWQAVPSWNQPSYSPQPQPSQPGPGPGRPTRRKSWPARRKLAALHRRIKVVSSLSG